MLLKKNNLKLYIGGFLEALKLLVDGGSLYMVHRVERVDEVIMELKNNHFGIKAYSRGWTGPVVRCDDDAKDEPF